MEKEQKSIRLLFLQDIFRRQTDSQHILSSSDLLVNLSKGYGITCERKALYRDIEALRDYGLDIVLTSSPKKGYYLKTREFSESEARLLIDAVQAAKFISSKKTKALIYKIGGLLSEYQEEDLREQIYVDSSFKSDKEDLFETISILDSAIKSQNQVQIVYAKHIIENHTLKIGEGKLFTVNPYALLWSNDHYYLVCNNDKYSNLMHLRLDRIIDIKSMNSKAKHFSKVSSYTDKFDTADYSNKIFNMFSGETGVIELRYSNEIIDDIIEKFGENIPIHIDDENHFIFRATAELSSGLVSWIMQYASDIKILSPVELKKAFIEKLQEISAIYE